MCETFLALSLKLDELHSNPIKVDIKAIDTLNNNIINNYFIPNTITFKSNSMNDAVSEYYIDFNGAIKGDYRILLNITSTDGSIVNTVPTNTELLFLIYDINEPVPPPTSMTSTFNNAGTSVNIKFPISTDRAGYDLVAPFSCINLFEFSEGQESSHDCTWLSNNTVQVITKNSNDDGKKSQTIGIWGQNGLVKELVVGKSTSKHNNNNVSNGGEGDDDVPIFTSIKTTLLSSCVAMGIQ